MSEQQPDVGEILVATVRDITSFGAYVSLDEYGGRNAFLHISEISTGWVRNIDRLIKVGQKVVLKVIRINERRNEVDCSLRQVSNEEKKQKLISVKREDRAKGILEMVKGKADDSPTREKILEKYGTLYDALAEIARKGPAAVEDLGLDKGYQDELIKTVQERFKLPGVEVKGMFEITCPGPDGVDVIKDSFAKAVSQLTESTVDITYGGAPRYLVRLHADNFKVAEKNLKAMTALMTKQVSKHGTVNFIRQ
ncbi:MAG: S1 RNA-binding domain-containing protein [Nitrososphaerota archaeon]|nr:S1 RNA-binding domain-containing protein [Nitrososphaerota archaeon]